MLGRQLFWLGVFLTPFALVRPVSEFGISIGDVALIAGSVLVVVGRLMHRTPRERSPWWVAVFFIPGALIVLSALVSTIVNQTAPVSAMVTLVSQYGVAMFLVPLVLAQEPVDGIAAAAKAFVYGLAASIALGLLIITFRPGLELSLTTRGWMVTLGAGRHGLFTGVGELSKTAGMSLGLIYYLVMRGRIGLLRAGLLGGAMVVALIVTRSGSGVGAAAAGLLVLGLFHLGLRRGVRSQTVGGGGSSRGLLVGLVGALAGMLALRKLDSMGTDYREAFVERIAAPFSNGGVEAVGSARVREQLISQAWSVIGDHPIFGIGPGLYHEQALYGAGVHVVPLMLWAETGLLALLGWVALIVGLLVAIWGQRRHAPIAAVAAMSVLTVFALTSLTAPYIYGRALILPMLLAFNALADTAPITSGRSAASPPPPSGRSRRGEHSGRRARQVRTSQARCTGTR